MQLRRAGLRGARAAVQLARAGARRAKPVLQLLRAAAGLPEAVGEALQVVLAALQQLARFVERLRQLAERLGLTAQRTGARDGGDGRVTRDLRLQRVELGERVGRRDRPARIDDDHVVGRRPPRPHRASDRFEGLPRLVAGWQLADIGRAGLQREDRHGERDEHGGGERAGEHCAPAHPRAGADEPVPVAGQAARGDPADRDAAAAQHERRGHHDDGGADGQRAAQQHADPERGEDLGRCDRGREQQREDQAAAGEQHGAPGAGDGLAREARAGLGGVARALTLGRCGVGVALGLVEAVEDQERVADAQRQARHRGQCDGDRVDFDHATEQRHQAEGREHDAGAGQRDGGGRQRRAQADEQQHEEDAERDQLGAARARERFVLQGPVDRWLAGDARVHGRGDVSCDERFDLRLVVRDDGLFGTIDRDDDHAGVGARAQAVRGDPGVPCAERTRVRALDEVAHQARPLAVERGARPAQQDRHQLGRAELGVGERLRA